MTTPTISAINRELQKMTSLPEHRRYITPQGTNIKWLLKRLPADCPARTMLESYRAG